MRQLLVLALCTASFPAAAYQEPDDVLADRLRARLMATEDPDARRAAEVPLYAVVALPVFYADRAFHPAWVAAGMPTPEARRVWEMLRAAREDGLNPAHYHVDALTALFGRLERARAGGHAASPGVLTDLELLLTDGTLMFGSHLLQGRIDPESIDPEWFANRRGADMAVVLTEALATGDVVAAILRLRPPQAGYERLRNAFARYRAIEAQGGWPTELVARLTLEADMIEGASLEDGVRRFQVRHGLAVTGTVDSATRAALDVPVRRRIHEIELNLERWRWLPQDLGPRHILVNIAAFHLEVIDADTVAMEMKVMVGRTYRRTPVFSGSMTYAVLAPYWHVPRNLAVQDKLPLILRDPGYLRRQGFRVYRGWGGDQVEVDPAEVDWAGVTPANFAYRLVQSPGPLNALGRVKFMFPNRFNVYLHDTPSRELFDQVERDFSSGCIRIERPLELAEFLLQDQTGWNRRQIEQTVAQAQERVVNLRRPVPVHVQYWTAWVARDGTLHFRRDLYGRDARLESSFHAPAPADD